MTQVQAAGLWGITHKTDSLDKLIAAHAVALNVTVVTNNMKDFAKYPGVLSENWLAATI